MKLWEQQENESDYDWAMDMCGLALVILFTAIGCICLLGFGWMVSR